MLVRLILNGGRVMSDDELLRLSSQIVAAYAANTELSTNDLRQLISDVCATLRGLGKEKTAPLEPAVPIKKSVTPDYLVCLEDGRKMKRHLSYQPNLTPEEYRAKWGLNTGFQLAAQRYSEQRSQIAKARLARLR
jgi:predicted transcriptional regulator